MNRSEIITLTNMCMIENPKTDEVLIQDRPKKRYSWYGYAFPGGHVEHGENIYDSVVREIYEETGLHISNLKLVGIKHWPSDNGRQIVFLYKTKTFSGELRSSEEGKVMWLKKSDLTEENTAYDMLPMMRVFEEEELSEFFYTEKINGKWDKNFR